MQNNLKKLFSSSPVLTIVGAYWGDEGKGKITDAIAAHYDVVARFGGGCNAGHTVEIPDGTKLVSHLFPCGLALNKVCVLGRKVLFDLKRGIAEYDETAEKLGGEENLPDVFIDHMCSLWTPWDRVIEQFLESCRGSQLIGTTGKAIGPIVGHHVLRIGPVVSDLFGPESALRDRLTIMRCTLLPQMKDLYDRISAANEQTLKHNTLHGLAHDSGMIELPALSSVDEVMEELLALAPRIQHMVNDTRSHMLSLYKQGAKILVEGSQAVGLDLTWGTYPWVTAGSTTTNGAPDGLGLPPHLFDQTLLIAKVFPTRVGHGPFPTEIFDRKDSQSLPTRAPSLFVNGSPERNEFLARALQKINNREATNNEFADYLQVLGFEVGATTGRGRSVGWPDLHWLSYAQSLTGATMLALTRLDMVSGLNEVPVNTGYYDEEQEYNYDPGCVPVTEKLGQVRLALDRAEGWTEDISECRDWDDLPERARNFVSMFAQKLEISVPIIGVSPSRDGMIVRG